MKDTASRRPRSQRDLGHDVSPYPRNGVIQARRTVFARCSRAGPCIAPWLRPYTLRNQIGTWPRVLAVFDSSGAVSSAYLPRLAADSDSPYSLRQFRGFPDRASDRSASRDRRLPKLGAAPLHHTTGLPGQIAKDPLHTGPAAPGHGTPGGRTLREGRAPRAPPPRHLLNTPHPGPPCTLEWIRERA